MGRSSADGPETNIELWCRGREGYSLLLLVTGVRPSLEISQPGRPTDDENIESKLEVVRSMKGVTTVTQVGEKWTAMGVKKHWRVEVEQPWAVTSGPNVRKHLEDNWEVTSADLPFVNRLFLDNDLGPHISAECEILWAGENAPPSISEAFAGSNKSLLKNSEAGGGGDFSEGGEFSESGDCCDSSKGGVSNSTDIRVKSAEMIRAAGGAGLYPVDVVAVCSHEEIRRSDPFQTPFVIFSFDLETSIVEETILCAAAVVEQGERREVHQFKGSEKEILSGLTKLVRESDPDIITGYNIDNFDLPRIHSRMMALAAKDQSFANELFGWGRVPILDSESKRLIPERERNRRTWRLHGRCVLDAWWQARQTLRPKRETLKYVCRLLWPDNEDLQKMDVDASKMDKEWAERPDVVMEYCVQDTILPLEILREISAVRRKEAIAAVAATPLDTTINGTTSQWIDSLVIRLADREKIAIPRTNRGGRGDQIVGGYVHDVDVGVHRWVAVLDFKSMYPSIMISKNICYTTRIDENARPDEVPESDYHESPLGAKFLPQKTRRGLVPRLLENLMSLRATHKNAMKEAKQVGDTHAEQFHDQMQYAVKILMNSFYGVFASKFYRFTHEDLGSSITAWARSNIKSIINQLGDEGYKIVYSDTDSVFVEAHVRKDAPVKEPLDGEDRQAWDEATEQLIKFGHELAERFTKDDAELEFETGLSSFFSHGAKKRYVGQVVWPETKLLVRGYEVRRTDSFTLLTDAMTEMFSMILDGEQEDAVSMVRELIEQVRNRDIRPRDLVISKSCKGKVLKNGKVDFNATYANPDRMVQVRAARQRIEAGLNFTPGMKVGWLVTDGSKSPMKITAWLEDETGEVQSDYDADWYVNRIANSLGRITEAFGWTADDLKKGNRQTNLFSF